MLLLQLLACDPAPDEPSGTADADTDSDSDTDTDADTDADTDTDPVITGEWTSAALTSDVDGALGYDVHVSGNIGGTPGEWVLAYMIEPRGSALVDLSVDGWIDVTDPDIVWEGWSATLVPDLDGDGVDDIVTITTETVEYDEYYNPLIRKTWLVTPGPLLGPPTEADVVASLESEVNYYLGQVLSPLGDVTGDGLEDVLATSSSGDARLLPTTGALTWEEAPIVISYGYTSSIEGSKIGDVTGDGIDDISLNLDGGRVFEGPLVAELYEDEAIAAYPPGVYLGLDAGDVDGDGYGDIQADWADRDEDALWLFAGPVGHSLSWEDPIATMSDATTVSPGLDADADGYADLVVRGQADGPRVWVFHGPLRGEISAEDAAFEVAPRSGGWAGFAPDVDGDGQHALIMADLGFSTLAASGGGVFRYALPGVMIEAPPDADGDGDPDEGDCDDADPAVHTRATDLPDDGVDQDCDGVDTSRDCARARTVVGNLWVTGTGAASDLAAFCAEGAIDLDGDVTITASDLEDLTELSCLCSATGRVTLDSNAGLASLAGLENMSAATGLSLAHNAVTSLTPIAGLEVSEGVRIDTEAALVSLDGLWVEGGSLFVYDNDALVSLEGIRLSSELSSSLFVEGNDALTALTGLEDLRHIRHGGLAVTDNLALADLTALYGLESVTSFIRIYENPLVTEADAWALVDAIETFHGTADVH